MIAETVVYETKKRKRRQNGRQCVGFTLNGLRHRYQFHGGTWRLHIKIGPRWRLCMNQELPRSGQTYRAHPQDGVCQTCGHIYSALTRTASQPCDECRTESLVAWGLAVQDWAQVNLGWTTTDHAYLRETHGLCSKIRMVHASRQMLEARA